MSIAPVLTYHIVPSRGVRDALVIGPDNPASAGNLRAQSLVRSSEVDLAFRFYKDTDAGALEGLDYGLVSVYFAARKRTPNTGEELFKVGPCARGVDGDGVFYSARAVLNTQAIMDALWDDESIQVLCEVHVEGGTESSRFKAAQFEATLFDDVLVSEAPPPEVIQSWPNPGTVNAALADTLAATAACESATAECVTTTAACNIAIGEANAATASIEAALSGAHFDGDQLVFNGIYSPNLTGPKGDQGDPGEPGSLSGSSGNIVVASSGTVTLSDASHNGKLIEVTASSGAVSIVAPDTLPVGFACEIINAGAGATVTFSHSGTKTRYNKDGLYGVRFIASVRTASLHHYIAGDLD